MDSMRTSTSQRLSCPQLKSRRMAMPRAQTISTIILFRRSRHMRLAKGRFDRVRYLILAVVFGFSAASATFAEDFVPRIPRGPSWQTFYHDSPECAHLVGNDPSTIFGFRAEQVKLKEFGLRVVEVAPGGPADGRLKVGDLLVSMNGDAFITSGLGGVDRSGSLWKGYSFVRGVYLFGFREGRMVEFILTPCGRTETHFPFSGGREPFGYLYDNVGGRKVFGTDILTTGFARGKAAAQPDSDSRENAFEPTQNYCWIKDSTRVSVVRTTGSVSTSGNVYNKRQSSYSYPVDLALSRRIESSFEETHNESRFFVRDVELDVSRLLTRIGCANPEWKGFEMKVYEQVGLDWHAAPTRAFDWNERSVTPPE